MRNEIYNPPQSYMGKGQGIGQNELSQDIYREFCGCAECTEQRQRKALEGK